MQSQWEIPGCAAFLKLSYFCRHLKSLRKTNVHQNLEQLSFSSPTMPTAAHSKQLKKWTPLAKIKQMFTCNERQSCRFDIWKRVAYKNRLYYSWDKTLTNSLTTSLYLLSLSNWRDLSWMGIYKSEWHLYISQNARLSYLTLLGRERNTYYSKRKKLTHWRTFLSTPASFLKQINKPFTDTLPVLI